MSSLSERIANLSPEKRELLLKRLEKKQENIIPNTIECQKRNINIFPLSFAQNRMWFLDRIEQENSAYNISTALRLTGILNVTTLKKCLEEIVRRHEILRTTFAVVEEKPVQIINNCFEFPFAIADLQSLPEVAKQKEVLMLAKEEAKKVFDLQNDKLLRISLIQLSSQENVVLFTMHHIVSDGWSLGILIKEVATLYQAFLEGKPSPLPELPIQYADFAVWQREWLTGEVLSTQLDYWHKQLQNIPLLNFPTDYPRPAITTYKGATQSFQLSESLTTAIKALSRQEGVTLFMTLLAAFKALLSRYSHQNDIVVGTPIANRNRAEIEGLIGFFVNTLVLRTNLDGNPSFTELIKRVREVTLGAYTHQDIPFEHLVEVMKVERHLNRHPLFDVMFTLENDSTEELKLPELTLSSLAEERKTAIFDITLSMTETEQGLAGDIEYSTDLFNENTIKRMVEHFQVLLEAIVTNPKQKVSQLPLLTAVEQYQLLREWNNTETKYPQDKCIHQLFEEQAEKTPDRIAVVFEEQQLTYRELNNRANQLAYYLQKQGIKPEKTVGICVNRSLEMAVAILGVLKAGGAYVPIDPTYPRDRITDILEDAGVEILLTQQHLKAEFQSRIQLVTLDSNWSDIERESTENYLSHATSENLAYIIYTSGSTGKPKGVAVTHKALVNYTLNITEQFKLHNTDRVLQFASIGFDVVVEELFPTWIIGATVVLLENHQLISCSEFQQLIAKQQLTVFELPTAYWHQWVSELSQSQATVPSCVRLVIVGGERISPERLKQWQQFSTPLLHVYGLTETTVTSTVYCLNSDAEPVKDGVELAIGRPIANTQIYILDSYLQPVPVGVVGEIYIGGEGIARGYLNRAQLTAERFIPNLFSHAPGERLYKTGDLAKYRDDGRIEYIGRIDYQVKLRGFRIELGEIESTLNRHPAIATSIVILREDLPGDRSLVAYVTLESEQIIEVSELRRFIESKLPKYMVPNAFVMLNSLPLTPNGKIDRKALPTPDPTQLVSNTKYIAPTTSLEKMLAEIWQEILGIERVGVDDNFFELGGHSLLLTQLISKLKHSFQVELPLRILYESPTIASLAEKFESIFQNGLSNAFAEETLIDLNIEATLDSTIFPKAKFINFNLKPNSLFLTGATGFLGAFLLYELLQQTQADIYCLVRTKDIAQGKQKLQEVLESYLIWEESFSHRIIPVTGDLAKPFLGLTEEQFQELANRLDVIYHNGAWVNHLYPYSVLKAANVLGTQEVIRLACTNKVKPIHYISTPDVFSSLGYSGVRLIKEQDSIDREKVSADGYTQTKWVAEKLIKTAEERGLPIYIYRPGRISGHSQTGVFNPNDFLHKLTISCIELGSVSEGNLIENIVPVDYVSQAIVYLSRQEESVGKAFHILNPQPNYIDKLIKVARSFNFSIQQVSYQQWQEKLINIANVSPNSSLSSLVPFFPAEELENERTDFAELEFDCQNTANGLANTSIKCPLIDEQLISNYLSCAIQKGVLKTNQLITQ
jgi:amino acid adenylation domain-containing protein/thioester reductase-like protein